MDVTRLSEARPYEAPRHHGMRALRLHGWDASQTDAFWVGLSYFLPGGGADWDATATEKVYVVIEGDGMLDVEGESVPVREGSAVFVEAGADHRFTAYEQLAVLVIFERKT